MSWFKRLFDKLFRKNKKDGFWETAEFGKPSTAGDDFRKINEV